MTKYIVTLEVSDQYDVEVDADNEAEAENFALGEFGQSENPCKDFVFWSDGAQVLCVAREGESK